MYIENPKTKDSGIICCIPQEGKCPMRCLDCFFQSGRSYLEPLKDNLPNMPPIELAKNRIVRVNDGNDSGNEMDLVMNSVKKYPNKFYNTSIPDYINEFDAPVVLTINPADMTDTHFHILEEIPKNLMFVRFRINMWNLSLADEAIDYYMFKDVPIILTFMAYYNLNIPAEFEKYYMFRTRTLNSYWAINTRGYLKVMDKYRTNNFVYSCGKMDSPLGNTKCKRCGNCLREYYATKVRMEEL